MPDPATLSRSQYLAQSAKTLLDSASLYQRRAADRLPKVMVVGDSQSESLGYGLERWTAEQHRALVWNRGAEGCGVVVAGAIHTFGSTGTGMEKCRTASEAWTPDLRSFDPAAVVVLTSITDVQDRKLPGSDTFSSIGQPRFDRFLVRQYEHVIDTLERDRREGRVAQASVCRHPVGPGSTGGVRLERGRAPELGDPPEG